MNVGDELDITVEAVSERGDGIVRKDEIVLFIPGVKKDEQHHIVVTKLFKKIGFAEVKDDTKDEESPKTTPSE
jgi:predicted RNA-binding protein with TRAM domain